MYSLCTLAVATIGAFRALDCAPMRIATIQGQSLRKKMLHTSSLVLKKSVHKSYWRGLGRLYGVHRDAVGKMAVVCF